MPLNNDISARLKGALATNPHTGTPWNDTNFAQADDLVNMIKYVLLDSTETGSSANILLSEGTANNQAISTQDRKAVHQSDSSIPKVVIRYPWDVPTTTLRPTITMTTVKKLDAKLAHFVNAMYSFCRNPEHSHTDISLLLSSDIEHADIDLCILLSDATCLNHTGVLDNKGSFGWCWNAIRKISYKDSEDKSFDFHGCFIGRIFYKENPTLWVVVCDFDGNTLALLADTIAESEEWAWSESHFEPSRCRCVRDLEYSEGQELVPRHVSIVPRWDGRKGIFLGNHRQGYDAKEQPIDIVSWHSSQADDIPPGEISPSIAGLSF